MTKLKTPLLSFAASNSIKNLFSFLKRRGQHLVESKPVPPDAKSLAQLSWRHMYLKAVALWHALSPAEQQDWESQARRRHMTGFAWFMSQALKPNPGLYLPLQGGTMAGEIVMDTNKISTLPDPLLSQDAATKAYVDLAVSSMKWDYSFNDDASGIGAYFEMLPEPTGQPKSTFTSAPLGAGDDQPLVQWISEDVVTFPTIESGILTIHIHAKRTAGNRNVNLYAKIYEYTNIPSELLIGTTEISAPVTDTEAAIVIHTSLPTDYDIALTSKLLVKVFANIGATGANSTVALYAEGVTSSRISVPVPTSALNDIYVRLNTFNAQSILSAIVDDTPIALTINQQRLVGRITGGNITGLTPTQIRTLINVENGAAADQTGLQIVALLEALGAGSRLSHTKLDDIAPASHHARYTDGEAVTAAKTVKLDDFATPNDNTDLNASNARHGLLLKLIDDATKYLRSDGAWAIVAAGAALTVAETEVFNGNAPTAWTDLDLSAVVGANYALVMLKFFGGASNAVAFRKNGDTDEFYNAIGADYAGGLALIGGDGGSFHKAVLVVTDSAGKIEWKEETARSVTIDIMAYVK